VTTDAARPDVSLFAISAASSALAAPATVIVNQNYESGWRADLDGVAATVGAFVAPEDRFWDIRVRPRDLPAKGAIGLLAVPLPAGIHHLILRHRPAGLWLGLLLSLIGTALAVVIVRRTSPSVEKDSPVAGRLVG